MKIILLFLVLLNVLFYGWSHWVAKQPLDLAVETPEPAAEPLVLFEEAYPERARAEREASRDTTTPTQPGAPREDDSQPSQPSQPDESAFSRIDIIEAPASLVARKVRDSGGDALPVPVDRDPLNSALSAAAATEPPGAVPTPHEAMDAVDELAGAAADAPAPVALALRGDGQSVGRCVTLGPFENSADAAVATARLREAGLIPAQRTEEASIWMGHWVYLPPASSRAEAVAVVEQLRADGVRDLYVETTGEMRHAVSLGLFSDSAGAETRAGKLRPLGVRPQVRDRFRSGTVYWLDFDLAPGQKLDPGGFKGGSARRELELREGDCVEDGATG